MNSSFAISFSLNDTLWCESLALSYEGGSYLCTLFWHTNIFLSRWRIILCSLSFIWLSETTLQFLDVLWARIVSLTPVRLCAFIMILSPVSQGQLNISSVTRGNCDNDRYDEWSCLHIFFESDKPRTLFFLRIALPPVIHTFTHLLKRWISCFKKRNFLHKFHSTSKLLSYLRLVAELYSL